MNHLAHALLAGPDAGWRLGGFLGDFMRGRVERMDLPRGVRDGIALHRAIDAYTDAHPQVVAARASFAAPLRRYAGILVDMAFDHLLARDFARWSDQSLADFSRQLRRDLHAGADALPPAARRFLAYMDAHDLPAGYADGETVARALAGIGRRLSRANPLDRAWPAIAADEPLLRACFARFFPDLRQHAQAWRAMVREDSDAPA